MIGTYSELLEGEFAQFKCNESIRAFVGGDVNSTTKISTKDPVTNITTEETVFKVVCGAKGSCFTC